MSMYLEFEVSLQEIKPRIWRRFVLKKSASFLDLHNAIQYALGWQDCHLYDFRTRERRDWRTIATRPSSGGSKWEDSGPSAKAVKLDSFFSGKRGERCVYVYDFGDDWYHDVKFVRAVESEEKFARRLLAGERPCPPEDCGGVPGYERMLRLLASGPEDDRDDEDVNDLREWLGDWNPDVFDLAAAKEKFDR